MKKEILIVSVEKKQKDWLKKIAKKQGVSIAHVIRNMVVAEMNLNDNLPDIFA